MKESPSTVVVQVVTYNNEATIARCIRSVKEQIYQKIQLVVVDNNSSDGTVALLHSVGAQTVVKNKKNTGYASAHNQALRLMDSTYVLTLNPDVTLTPSFVSVLVSEMDRAPENVGSAQALLYRVDGAGKGSHTVDSAGVYINRARRQNLRFGGEDAQLVRLEASYIFGPDGAAAFYRRKMLCDINLGEGIFDEDFFMHKEDVDVDWRAQLRGWKSIFVPRAVAYHIRTFRPGERAGISKQMRADALRNRYYLILKNDIGAVWLRDFLWIFLYDFGILWYVLLHEWSSLRAYCDAVKNFRLMCRKRLVIQKSRKTPVSYMARWFRDIV